MSKTHVVATYGGENFGTVTIYEDGFWDGVQYYNTQHHTNVKVLGWNEQTQKGSFIGNFTDLGAGQSLTNTFIGDGADVIFPVAGGVGLGTAKAVQTADSSGKNVYMEWVDTDGCVSAAQYCKYMLTSVTKGITEAVKTAVLAAAGGTFARRYLRRHPGQRRRGPVPVSRPRRQGSCLRCRPRSRAGAGDRAAERSCPPPRARSEPRHQFRGTWSARPSEPVSCPGPGLGSRPAQLERRAAGEA